MANANGRCEMSPESPALEPTPEEYLSDISATLDRVEALLERLANAAERSAR